MTPFQDNKVGCSSSPGELDPAFFIFLLFSISESVGRTLIRSFFNRFLGDTKEWVSVAVHFLVLTLLAALELICGETTTANDPPLVCESPNREHTLDLSIFVLSALRTPSLICK
uniref:Uncharacterized protein n=1 Tax=Ditylenchus dipsaci TaxID=166011 RepID=A0A915DLV1_9BILA